MQLADHIIRFRVDDCVYPEGGTLGPRVQTSLQLFYVYSGHCHVFVDGEEQHVGANEILLLLPDHVETFRYARTEKTHHGFCSAVGVRLSDQQRSDYQTLTEVFPLSPKIRELTDWAKTLASRSDAPAINLYNQIARLLFAEFFRIAGYPEQTVQLPQAVVRARELIDLHYTDPLDLAAMAHAACVSPTHLIRLFKAHLGVTPVAYLWQVRTEQGARMLEETGLGIAEVAYRCGFAAPYHFDRRFKARFGMTPGAYRRRHWGQ
jgi:AraC-like DNA-binding protein